MTAHYLPFAAPKVPACEHGRAFSYLLGRPDKLNHWERGFLRSTTGRTHLSVRQVAVLLDVLERVKRREART